MNLFGRNKKSEIAEKVSKNSKWNKDLKSNTVNKTGTTQEGFEFNKRTVDKAIEETGLKKGLRHFLKEITQDQIKILKNCAHENTAADLIKILERTNQSKFKAAILKPLVTFGFLVSLCTQIGASVKLSTILRCGNKLKCWNTIDTSDLTCLIFLTSSVSFMPSTITLPS